MVHAEIHIGVKSFQSVNT